MNNFTQRVLSSIVLIPLILLIIFKLPSIYFIIFIAIITLIAGLEFCKIATLNKLLAFLPVAIFAMYFYLPFNPFALFLVSIIFWILNFFIVAKYPALNNLTSGDANRIFTLIILFTPFAIAITILQSSPILLIVLLTTVITADSFAYFSGKLLGKHKLTPKLSGGKTIEGVIGGIFFALLFAGLYAYYLDVLSLQLLIIILITAIISVIGDLYQSVYKREAGVKDSGNIIPGHGGIWDRIDGFVAGTPVFFFLVPLELL